MKRIGITLAALAFVAFVSCKNEKKEADNQEDMQEETMKEDMDMENDMDSKIKKISFDLNSKSNSNATGKVVFSEKDGLVSLNANLKGLNPGTHAIHIHEKADCSAADGTSAGGHWNPTYVDHGKWGSSAYHKGDIGNFEADADGTGFVSMQTDEWCIGCGDPKKDITGKSIIVHEGVDDFTSQPSGAAGARVSCGGIIQ